MERKIKSMFNLGERVFVTNIKTNGCTIKKCWLCGGTGEVNSFDGTQTKTCPACHGEGNSYYSNPWEKVLDYSGQVFIVNAAESLDGEWSETYSIRLDDGTYRYNVEAENIFRTKDGALEACRQYAEETTKETR